MKKIIFILFGLLLSLPVFAKDLRPVVEIMRIKPVKEGSRHLISEEVYLNIAEYPQHKSPRDYTIPVFPIHWISKMLQQIKNLPVWHDVIKEGDSIKLIISLVEADTPPWDPDDLIGDVELELKNQTGSLVQNWRIPTETHKLEMITTREVRSAKIGKTVEKEYEFTSKSGIYVVTFRVKSE